MLAAAGNADLILWVSAANRPDRQMNVTVWILCAHSQAARLDRRPPPLLVVASYIDRLRPVNEWRPPYD